MITHLTFAFALLSCSILWGQETKPIRTPIGREEIHRVILAAFRGQGVPERQLPQIDDIELPAALSALSDRTLHITDVNWNAARGRAEVRIECAPGECVPFLVAVRMERSALPSGNASKSHAKRVRQKTAVRSGDRAVAIFITERMHLTASVVCLERGDEGDVIRVRNQDGHIFRARISGPGLLEVLPQ